MSTVIATVMSGGENIHGYSGAMMSKMTSSDERMYATVMRTVVSTVMSTVMSTVLSTVMSTVMML
jgi:hypothetical protein